MKWCLRFAALGLGGCDSLPRDFDGTSQRVHDSRAFRVGLIAGSNDGHCPDMAARYLGRVSAATGARPITVRGPAEALLGALRRGEIDLVVGELDRTSPWAREVTIIEPLASNCQAEVEYSAVARNGENRWIMLLEDAGRAVRQPGEKE